MILMVIGGNKQQRQDLSRIIGASVPNTVVRRSIYQPIKTVVSENDPNNKLTLVGPNLPYIGDTTDFVNHSNANLLAKIDAVKATFEANFSKDYMVNHFNVGLATNQYFRNVVNSRYHKAIFIIDDIEKKDDLAYLHERLKKLCYDSDHTIGKSLFSSINELIKKGPGIDSHENDRIRSTINELTYYERNRRPKDEVAPEILTIVIRNENNSITQVYPGATIETMDDLSAYSNVVEISSKDLTKDTSTLSLLIYNIFYKNEAKKEFK